MRAARIWGIIPICLLICLTGCKHRDLVEAELRYQNRRVRELEQKLCQKQSEVCTLQSMVDIDPTCESGTKDTPETVYRREAMSRVGLGLTTGPRDLDHNGCEEAFQFTVVCYDYDGDAFKCPGKAECELIAVHESGVPQPVGCWDVDPNQLRQTWRSSLIGAGYQIVVPAPMLEESRKWKAVVRFSTLDGRVFQTEKDIQLAKRPSPLPPQAPLMQPPVPPSPAQPPTIEPLPNIKPIPADEPEAILPESTGRIPRAFGPVQDEAVLPASAQSAPPVRFLKPQPVR